MCKSSSSLSFAVVSAIFMLTTSGASRLVQSPDEAVAAAVQAFPASSALEEGVSPEALGRLGTLVQSFVDDGDVVGAELMVIKNGRTILHEGYGLKDKAQEIPMGTGNVFCVRSMTKPLIGTSILMLAGEKQLKLSDPVSMYLPAFAGEGQGEITIEHLLTHTSGLPMSLIFATDLRSVDGIQAVAQLGAECELEFAPGTAFNYSDQGTDTLTAVLEVVSGMSAADFVRERVLDPLGMQHSTCVMDEDNALRELACCKYTGTRNAWNSFWCPDDPALFPFFLGSQGLYSTLEDYARFMELWLHKGRSREERLISARYVRKALVPNEFPFPASSGLSGLEADYGFLMQLWLATNESGKRQVKAFGHSGSDGTMAWVFPEQDAIVLYFTQSRGNTTGMRFEEALSEVFLGATFDPNLAAPPFEEYLGYYAEDENSRYQAVIRDGESLALETPGRRIRQLIYAGGDRWKFRIKPSIVIEFARDSHGDVMGFQIGELQPEVRFEPSTGLPSVAEVEARIARTHHVELLESVGPARMTGTLNIEKLGITGEMETWIAWPNQFRVTTQARGQIESVAYDGVAVWYESSATERMALEGERASAALDESLFTVFGDWSARFPTLEVIQMLTDGERQVVLVRAGDSSGPALTFFVDWMTGRLIRVARVSVIEGMGRVGQKINYGDFRDVSGVLMPFRTEVEIGNAMIGTVVITTEDYELGVTPPDGTFDLKE